MVHELLVRVIGRCGDIRYACAMAGIGKTTYYAWRRQADEGVEPYATLMADVDRVRSSLFVDRLERIQEIGQNDWRALAMLQAKQDPQRYGDKIEVTRADQDGSSAAWEELSEDELLREVAEDPRVIEAVKRKLGADDA